MVLRIIELLTAAAVEICSEVIFINNLDYFYIYIIGVLTITKLIIKPIYTSHSLENDRDVVDVRSE